MAISRLSTRWRRLTGFRRVARRWSRASKSPRGASRSSFDGHEAWTSDEAWAAANQSPSMMSALTSSAWRPRKQPRKEPRKQPRKQPRKRENGNIFQRWNYFDSERFSSFSHILFFQYFEWLRDSNSQPKYGCANSQLTILPFATALPRNIRDSSNRTQRYVICPVSWFWLEMTCSVFTFFCFALSHGQIPV